MLVAEQVLAATRSHLGVSENPAGSNCQPFTPALHRSVRCEAWCADYRCYCDRIDCGLDFAWLGLGEWGSASCGVITQAAIRKGRFGHVARVCAWVMFGPSGTAHIEFVTAIRVRLANGTVVELDECGAEPPPGSTLLGVRSVGGNTSAPSNYAGGTVAEHWRTIGAGDDIYGYVYPPYSDAPAPPVEEDDVPYILKCIDPKHSEAQYAVVGGNIGLIPNGVELKACLEQGYETHALPSLTFDNVLKAAGALPKT